MPERPWLESVSTSEAMSTVLCSLAPLGQAEPRVALSKDESVVPGWPHPWRVAELQAEAATTGEHRRECQLPMEEALIFAQPLGHAQPVVRPQHLGDGPHLRERALLLLSEVEVSPGGVVVEHASATLDLGPAYCP